MPTLGNWRPAICLLIAAKQPDRIAHHAVHFEPCFGRTHTDSEVAGAGKAHGFHQRIVLAPVAWTKRQVRGKRAIIDAWIRNAGACALYRSQRDRWRPPTWTAAPFISVRLGPSAAGHLCEYAAR